MDISEHHISDNEFDDISEKLDENEEIDEEINKMCTNFSIYFVSVFIFFVKKCIYLYIHIASYISITHAHD